MRRLLLVLCLIAVPATVGVLVPASAEDALPFVPRPCTAEPGDQGVQPVAGCQRILYKYGPVHVTPGDNLILIGPVLLEKPYQAGFVTRFKPDLVRVDGSVPPIEQLHLHHAVWISSRHNFPFAASGEEKTMFSMPTGYGVRVGPDDNWLLNYMLHNQLVTPDNVFITYEIDFVPAAAATLAGVKDAVPVWLNVGNFNGANPIYNTLMGWGSTKGECAFPKEQCAPSDPYGKQVVGNGLPGNGVGWTLGPVGNRSVPAGTVVWMAGHLHPGGKRIDVNLRRGGEAKPVFTSRALYFDPYGPVSWDMVMEVTKPDYRLQIKAGDTFVVNSVYETEYASWYEGMGIVVMFIAPGDTSGPDLWGPDAKTFVGPNHNGTTHGHLAEADNYGGPDGDPLGDVARIATNRVAIAGFSYLPGNLGTADTIGIPAVKKGETLTFTNLDAPAQVFHTVTACKAPCNGGTGISYPLANGAKEFDSLQLGYGPPSLTAAANRMDYRLDTASFDPGTYTYFCRVHPSMRGAFEVTS